MLRPRALAKVVALVPVGASSSSSSAAAEPLHLDGTLADDGKLNGASAADYLRRGRAWFPFLSAAAVKKHAVQCAAVSSPFRRESVVAAVEGGSPRRSLEAAASPTSQDPWHHLQHRDSLQRSQGLEELTHNNNNNTDAAAAADNDDGEANNSDGSSSAEDQQEQRQQQQQQQEFGAVLTSAGATADATGMAAAAAFPPALAAAAMEQQRQRLLPRRRRRSQQKLRCVGYAPGAFANAATDVLLRAVDGLFCGRRRGGSHGRHNNHNNNSGHDNSDDESGRNGGGHDNMPSDSLAAVPKRVPVRRLDDCTNQVYALSDVAIFKPLVAAVVARAAAAAAAGAIRDDTSADVVTRPALQTSADDQRKQQQQQAEQEEDLEEHPRPRTTGSPERRKFHPHRDGLYADEEPSREVAAFALDQRSAPALRCHVPATTVAVLRLSRRLCAGGSWGRLEDGGEAGGGGEAEAAAAAAAAGAEAAVEEATGELLVLPGTLHAFQQHVGCADDFGDARFCAVDVQRLAVLDVRLFNTDRHGGNVLVTSASLARPGHHHHHHHCLHRRLHPRHTNSNSGGSSSSNTTTGGSGVRGGSGVSGDGGLGLVPIDHGLCLPDLRRVADGAAQPEYAWAGWRGARGPLPPGIRDAVLRDVDARADAALLRRLGIRESCVATSLLATLFLQWAVGPKARQQQRRRRAEGSGAAAAAAAASRLPCLCGGALAGDDGSVGGGHATQADAEEQDGADERGWSLQSVARFMQAPLPGCHGATCANGNEAGAPAPLPAPRSLPLSPFASLVQAAVEALRAEQPHLAAHWGGGAGDDGTDGTVRRCDSGGGADGAAELEQPRRALVTTVLSPSSAASEPTPEATEALATHFVALLHAGPCGASAAVAAVRGDGRGSGGGDVGIDAGIESGHVCEV